MTSSQITRTTEYHFERQLADSRYPCYLCRPRNSQKKYVIKLFPFRNQKPSLAFLNESRFSKLDHPNIISQVAKIHEKKFSCHNQAVSTSYILYEFAQFGDLADLSMQLSLKGDEKLVRTLFQMLMKGVEYLHSQDISHMDLKLENLLLDSEYNLKICDFDLSHKEGDSGIIGKGTINYRAPELQIEKCRNPKKADIFSAGIILFSLLTGIFPYLESMLVENCNLFEMAVTGNNELFEKHKEFGLNIECGEEFKNLFFMMVQEDPNERASVEEIMNHAWYKGEVYTKSELKELLISKGLKL